MVLAYLRLRLREMMDNLLNLDDPALMAKTQGAARMAQGLISDFTTPVVALPAIPVQQE